MRADAVSASPIKPVTGIWVSILIVNYRAYRELEACLASLQPFAGDDLEIIVIDHASDAPALQALRQTFPACQFIPVPANPGFAAGVNRAAALARGRHLLLLNPDSIANGDVARVLAGWMDQHPRVAVCGGLVQYADGSVQPSARRFPDMTTGFAGRTTWLTRVWPTNPWTRRNLVTHHADAGPAEVDWVSGACTMVRRDAFEAVGGMDEQFFLYWEDADLCYRLKRAGWSTAYTPIVGVTHLTGRSSAYARRQSLIAFHRSAYQYFVKHGGRFAQTMAPLVFLTLRVRLLFKLAGLRFAHRDATDEPLPSERT